MKVIKIQEVLITMTDAQTSNTVTLPETVGNLSRSVCWGSYTVGDLTSAVTQEVADYFMVDIWLEDASTLKIERELATTGVTVTARIYVIEFHESVTVQKGTFSMGAAELTDDVTINAVDLTKAFCVSYWKVVEETTPVNGSDPDCRMVSNRMTSTTNLQFEREAADGAISGHWWIAEDTDTTVSQETFTKNTAVTVDNYTLGASRSVVMADTFVSSSHRSASSQWNDEGVISLKLDSTTQLEMNCAFGSTDEQITENYVVEDSALTVQHITSTYSTGFPDNITINEVDLDLAIVVPTGHPTSTGDSGTGDVDVNRGVWVVWFTSSTNVRLTKDQSGGVNSHYQVIEFEQGVNSSRRKVVVI